MTLPNGTVTTDTWQFGLSWQLSRVDELSGDAPGTTENLFGLINYNQCDANTPIISDPPEPPPVLDCTLPSTFLTPRQQEICECCVGAFPSAINESANPDTTTIFLYNSCVVDLSLAPEDTSIDTLCEEVGAVIPPGTDPVCGSDCRGDCINGECVCTNVESATPPECIPPPDTIKEICLADYNFEPPAPEILEAGTDLSNASSTKYRITIRYHVRFSEGVQVVFPGSSATDEPCYFNVDPDDVALPSTYKFLSTNSAGWDVVEDQSPDKDPCFQQATLVISVNTMLGKCGFTQDFREYPEYIHFVQNVKIETAQRRILVTPG
ncbi:MAG: hypothetical protein KIT69_21580, partial [Propionibacteriaceae bacterium]|nr:hypothetical protein [Propionibacteriaceae bacterium]